MSSLVFYKQFRKDGGVRIGVEVDETTVLHQFTKGSEESDPALDWYADLRCEGRSLPQDPEEVRAWLLDHSAVIQKGFEQVADELEAGMDLDFCPLQREIGAVPSVKMRIVCSAVRRLGAREIARDLARIARQWKTTIRNLPAFVPQ
jgi:hypothetical protein